MKRLIHFCGHIPLNHQIPDKHVPIHFRIPMGRDPEILLSIHENGNYVWSLPDDPCDRLAASAEFMNESHPLARGPTIFVEVDLKGSYFTRPPLPDGKPLPTMQRVINEACAVLGRPSPLLHLPQSQNDFISSLVKPARVDIIADCLSSPSILTLDKWEWGIMFYIRVDLGGSYHVYPHVGGPFQSLEEVHYAIGYDLKQRQDPKMMAPQPEDTQVDYVVRQCLYWPDGKRKKGFDGDERRDRGRLLAHALVDKYNDYIGGLAYELQDVVHYGSVCVRDSYMLTYHINFTAKMKGTEELFFAEVTSDCKTSGYGEHKLVVRCFCTVNSTDNGRCYGCKAQHPNAAVYSRGRADACFPFGASDPMVPKDYDEDPDAEEKRLRLLYKSMDEPGYMEKMRAIMNGTFTDQDPATSPADEEGSTSVRRSKRLRKPNSRYL